MSLLMSPSSQPLSTTNLLSVFMDLHVLDVSYKWNHTLCVLLGLLLSLSIVCSRSIHVVACVRASLLFMAESHCTVWMDVFLFFLSETQIGVKSIETYITSTSVWGGVYLRPLLCI